MELDTAIILLLADVDVEFEDESFDEVVEFNKGDSAATPCVDSGVLESIRDTSDCRSHVAVGVSLLVRSASGTKGSSGNISSK